MFGIKFIALLAIHLSLELFLKASAVDIGFEQIDTAAREGRQHEHFFIEAFSGTSRHDIILRFTPLTVMGFQKYRKMHPTKIFHQTTLNLIANIKNPAEYDDTPGGAKDFNNTEFTMIFPANANELKVPITNSLVFDDDIHEANEETFLILMTVDFSNPKEAVALQPSRDVLIFNIIDNDGLIIGFAETSFMFPENVGVLTDVFIVKKLYNKMSEVNITVIVNITQDSTMQVVSAMQGVDYLPTSGQYQHTIQLMSDQQNVSVPPIEIINDEYAESNETFLLSLSMHTNTQSFNYHIQPTRTVATVVVTDNDGVVVGFTISEINITEGIDKTVEICISLQQGSFNDSTANLMLEIVASPTSRAALLDNYQQQITINSFQTLVCFDVTINDDTNIEARECATLIAKTRSANVNVDVNPNEVRICIKDDNVPIHAVVGFSSTQYTASEGTGEVQVIVSLQSLQNTMMQTFSGTFIVSLTTGGSAQAMDDFIFSNHSVKINNSITSVSLNIPIIDDKLLEGNETFFLTLTSIINSLVGIDSFISPNLTEIVILDNDELTVRLQGISHVEEGMNTSVCIQGTSNGRTNAIGQAFTVELESTEISAEKGRDFLGLLPKYIFTSTSLPARICNDIHIINDKEWEGPEVFQVYIEQVSNERVSIGPINKQNIQIIDDEILMVSFNQSTYNATEGDSSVDICIEVGSIPNGGLAQDLIVSLQFISAEALIGQDFQPNSQSVTFPSGITRDGDVMCNEVTIIDDDNLEGDQSFEVSIASIIPGRGSSMPINITTVVIHDNHEVTATLALIPNKFMEDVGTVQACVTIGLTSVTEVSLTVILSSQDGTATQPKDYRHSDPFQVTFPNASTGSMTACANITIIDDNLSEGNQDFSIAIESTSIPPPIVMIGTTIQLNATILDNDVATIGFGQKLYTTMQGTGSVTVSVVLVSGTLDNAAIEYTIFTFPGTATEEPEYISNVSGVISSTNNQSYHTFAVLNDNNVNLPNTVFINIAITGSIPPSLIANVNSDRTAVQIIGVPIHAVVGFSSTQYTASEETGEVQVIVSLQSLQNTMMQTFSGTFIVSLTTGGSAQALDDFIFSNHSVKINNSITSVSLTIPIIDDKLLEGNETFFLTLTSIINSLVGIDSFKSPNLTEIVILDNDELTVQLQGISHVEEGMNTSVCIQGTSNGRTNAIGQAFTVELESTEISAEKGRDFLGLLPKYIFTPKSLPARICNDIHIINDKEWEGPEIFQVYIEQVSNERVSIGLINKQNIQIIDDEILMVSFNQSTYNATEGDSSVDICIEVGSIPNGGLAQDLIVSLQFISAEALIGQDFQPNSQSVTFPSGITRDGDVMCNEVTIIDDDNLEGDQSFEVSIASIFPGRGSSMPINITTVVIHDNHEVTATLALIPNEFMEDVGTVQACVTIGPTGVTEVSLTVILSSQDGTATQPNDYRHSDPFQVTFPNASTGSMTTCANITIIDDNLSEGNQDFSIAIESTSIPPPIVMIGTIQLNATIQDNDVATIGFGQTNTAMDGTGIVNVSVVLVSGTLDDAAIEYTIFIFPGNATEELDYNSTASTASGVISSTNNQSYHTFDISKINRMTPSETFFLKFEITGSIPSSLIAIANPDRINLQIINGSVVTIGFLNPWYSVVEGTPSVQVCVGIVKGTLASDSEIVFDLKTQQAPIDSALESSDYMSVFQSKTITPNITKECIQIPIKHDNEQEHPEKFIVAGTLQSNRFRFNPDFTEVWIIDKPPPIRTTLVLNCSKNNCEDFVEIVACNASGPISRTYCSYDDNLLQACTIPILINVSNFCEGMHVLKITVVDENGLNATETIEFQVGANETTLQLFCKEENIFDGKVQITCQTNRVLRSLKCSVDNRPSRPCALEQVIDPLVLKNAKILTITAIDTRGVVATYIHMLDSLKTTERTAALYRNDTKENDDDDLTGGEVAGIVIGSFIFIIILIVLLLLLLLCLWCCCCR